VSCWGWSPISRSSPPASTGSTVCAPSKMSAGMSLARISVPGASTTMLSIRFRSCRTLPCQGAFTSRCSASAVIPRKGRRAAENSRMAARAECPRRSAGCHLFRTFRR
jgi:hypothetical protein